MATKPSAGVGSGDDMDISEEAGNGENFPTFLSRHGSTSVRSIVSSKMSLAEIVETEPPMTLTQQALDEADRAAAGGEDSEDEDTIRASAHQHVDEHHNMDVDGDELETPQAEVQQPLIHNDFFDFSAPPALQIHQPDGNYDPYETYESHAQERERPLTSGSGATYEQNAFGDFDGVHCDPETSDFAQPEPELQPPQRQEHRMSRAPPAVLPSRPKSYFDMDTGQQMLYYPARVPAMLNLPPKLSKNGNKLSARQKVRSQVLSVLPQDSRESRIWLPDPLAGLGESSTSLARDGGEMNLMPGEPLPARASFIADSPEPEQSQSGSFHARQREIRRPQRLGDADARKSRMTVAGDLPAHLRASVFFDLPSDAPRIVVKDHSAIATLDSILDASASAPVSAFTDHAFAGKLGSEVYGVEKKRARKSKADGNLNHKRSDSSATNLTVIEPKKRASFLSLLGPRRKSSENLGADTRRNTLAVGEGEIGRVPSAYSSSGDGQSPNVDQGLFSPNPMAPDSDEEPDKEEDEEDDYDDDEEAYQGLPTTLLAELQLRKQRNKLRTQPIQRVYPNGIHSTLLELDTVAQVERDMRKQKKVNLAWEDPAMNRDLVEEEDDEEVPLAMLAAAKAAAAAKGVNRSTLDISAVMDEVNRPLGLMERRELEENEPLSRRRDRLQGRGPRETMNLETMQKRMTTLSLVHGGAGLKSQSRLALPLPSPSRLSAGSGGNSGGDDGEPEVEGETLAERRKRMQGNTLPQARPVSGAFSLELLNQFGGDDKDAKGKGKAVDNGPPSGELPEESETLGQRRRRLQAEREAREREMGSGWTASTPQLLDTYVSGDGNQRLSRRTSMADILADHPLEGRQGTMDPREQEQLRLQMEAETVQKEQEAKMARLRAQMPQSLPVVGVGAYNGGYRSGQFNDGGGGRLVSGSGSGRYGIPDVVRPPPQRMSTMPATYGAPAPLANPVYGAGLPGVQSAYGMVPAPAAYGGPAAYGAPATYGAPYNGYDVSPPQQLDMVERWRQSIMPS